MAGPPSSDWVVKSTYTVKIVGVTFPNRDGSSRQAYILGVQAGEALELRPEPDNPVDPNAVAVYTRSGRQLGYLASQWGNLSSQLQGGAHIDCTAVRRVGGPAGCLGALLGGQDLNAGLVVDLTFYERDPVKERPYRELDQRTRSTLEAARSLEGTDDERALALYSEAGEGIRTYDQTVPETFYLRSTRYPINRISLLLERQKKFEEALNAIEDYLQTPDRQGMTASDAKSVASRQRRLRKKLGLPPPPEPKFPPLASRPPAGSATGSSFVADTRESVAAGSSVLRPVEPDERAEAASLGCVGAIVSLLMPGVGQLVQGRLLSGLGWIFAVVLGYTTFTPAGYLLHFLCVLNAARGKAAPMSKAIPAHTGYAIIITAVLVIWRLADSSTSPGVARGNTSLPPAAEQADDAGRRAAAIRREELKLGVMARRLEVSQPAGVAGSAEPKDGVVWEETPEARIKVKYESGREVGRWVFPRVPPAPTVDSNVSVDLLPRYHVSEP